MAHTLVSLKERRSTTTAIFLLPFCEKAFLVKESPPKMSPPAFLLAFGHDKQTARSVFLTENCFLRKKPSAFAWCIAIHWVCGCAEFAVGCWARNGRLSSCTNTENMAPSLCVSAQPLHCLAIRGSRATAYLPHFNSHFNTLFMHGKMSKYAGWKDERYNFYFTPRKTHIFSSAG